MTVLLVGLKELLRVVLQVVVGDVQVSEGDVDFVEDLPENKAVLVELNAVLLLDALQDTLDRVEDRRCLVRVHYQVLLLQQLLLKYLFICIIKI